MTPAVQAALTRAANELSQLRTEVTLADIASFDPVRTTIFTSVRALAYVRASAVLEQYTKTVLGAVLTEIDTRGFSHDTVKLGLHAILQRGTFDSAKAARGPRMWAARVDLLEGVSTASTGNFGLTEFALDGRTLRADHFDIVWRVFGFPLPSVPRPVVRLALSDLADTRNDLAHGKELPADIARRKPTHEVLRMVGFVEEIVEHLALTVGAYLTTNLHVR